jgi:hypothetical protein
MAGPRGETTAGPGLQTSIPNWSHHPSPNSDTNCMVVLSARTLCLSLNSGRTWITVD